MRILKYSFFPKFLGIFVYNLSAKLLSPSKKSENREETSVEMGIMGVLVQNVVGGASSNKFFCDTKN